MRSGWSHLLSQDVQAHISQFVSEGAALDVVRICIQYVKGSCFF